MTPSPLLPSGHALKQSIRLPMDRQQHSALEEELNKVMFVVHHACPAEIEEIQNGVPREKCREMGNVQYLVVPESTMLALLSEVATELL